jgi:hypothetical protein
MALRSATKIVLMSTLLALAACSRPVQHSNSGDPAARLIGHWATSLGDGLFFSPIGPNGMGNYVLVHPDGNVFNHHYKVLSQNVPSGTVVVREFYASGGTGDETFEIADDGKALRATKEVTGMQVTSDLKRVDEAVAP